MRPIGFVLCAAAAYPLWGADVETQHALDVTLQVRPKLELILHSRIRTQPGGLGFYQFRAGPIVSWDATPRITLLSGYYYAQQERKIDSDFIGGHRLFGGAEIAVAGTRRWAFDQRFLTERLLAWRRYFATVSGSGSARLGPADVCTPCHCTHGTGHSDDG